MPPTAKTPGAWRRFVTGIIGFPLVGLGLPLGAFGFYHLARGCGCATSDSGWCGLNCLPYFAAFWSGGAMALLGAPFALATVAPFGEGRRILVGTGAAALGGIPLGFALMAAFQLSGALAIPAAAGLFCVAFRLAR